MLETKEKVLRDFPGYEVEIPPAANYIGGDYNVHLPVTDPNGKKWMARARYSATTRVPQKFLDSWNESEAATLAFLATASTDAKVPRILVPTPLKDYFLVEFMEGTPASPPILAENFQGQVECKRLFRDFALHYIALSNIHRRGIGGLHFGDTRDSDATKVGAPTNSHGANSSGTVYHTNAENYTALINDVLRSLELEMTKTSRITAMYLVHLEMRRIVNHPNAGMSEPALETYVTHGEAKGTHFLLKEGRLTGVLDWDWSSCTIKEEAFTAPCAFWDFGLFFDKGSNELSASEKLLVEAYVELGREDLAHCVRNGKKYQRLWCMLGERGDIVLIKGLQAACGLAVDQEETLEEWCKMAAIRFKEEIAPSIQHYMTTGQ